MTVKLWTNDSKAGVEILDADHIIIFSLINHIDDAHQSCSDKQAIGKMPSPTCK
jgi:hemerythrin